MKHRVSRRAILASGAALPFAFDTEAATVPGPPPYTLSINIEIMFPRTMPRPERMKVVAAEGFKAYSFWNTTEQEQDAMLEVQEKTGLRCASITGPGTSGNSTGLTRPGMEKLYLDDITAKVKMASRFGGPQPIIFVGRNQADVAWEQQRSQIVSGLKKAGDIAAERGITLVVEPLSSASGQPRMALDTAAAAFPAIEDVSHPHVKICFDMYHLQLMEGNITTHLREGLGKGLIGLVQMGEVPGRKEPGTGEIDYAYMMRVLRESNYKGYFDTEMGTSTTPERAMQLARKMSLAN
ncbi:MAG TPA: TIM barrel protein [Bryobacteraceae bacterium]|jgi:hydroxypyruvate isomerase|nr:TIM barrel protein [Bryobacteraceae bacterium]